MDGDGKDVIKVSKGKFPFFQCNGYTGLQKKNKLRSFLRHLLFALFT